MQGYIIFGFFILLFIYLLIKVSKGEFIQEVKETPESISIEQQIELGQSLMFDIIVDLLKQKDYKFKCEFNSEDEDRQLYLFHGNNSFSFTTCISIFEQERRIDISSCFELPIDEYNVIKTTEAITIINNYLKTGRFVYNYKNKSLHLSHSFYVGDLEIMQQLFFRYFTSNIRLAFDLHPVLAKVIIGNEEPYFVIKDFLDEIFSNEQNAQ